jgi:transposase
MEQYNADREIIFIDETTFNRWQWKKKRWMSMDEPEKVTLVPSRVDGSTLIGAISNKKSKMSYKVSGSRCTWMIFKQFLEHMFLEWPSSRKALIIFDSDPKHRKKEVTAWLDMRKIEYQYQPAGSCQLNPIEHCWGTLKNAWRTFLHDRQGVGIQMKDWHFLITNLVEEHQRKGFGKYWHSCFYEYSRVVKGYLE